MKQRVQKNNHTVNRLALYLLLIAAFSAFCFLTLDVWLMPYSIAHSETGKITAGYLLYAAIGIVFSTQSARCTTGTRYLTPSQAVRQ